MNKKAIYITAGVLVVLTAVWYFFLRKKTTVFMKNETDKKADQTLAPVDTHKEILGNASFPIKRGSKGIQVLFYQAYLNVVKGAEIVDLDGIWGKETERNSKEFNNNAREISETVYNGVITPVYWILKSYLNTYGYKL